MFLCATTHINKSLCPSVDLLVCLSVTHSCDDPHVAHIGLLGLVFKTCSHRLYMTNERFASWLKRSCGLSVHSNPPNAVPFNWVSNLSFAQSRFPSTVQYSWTVYLSKWFSPAKNVLTFEWANFVKSSWLSIWRLCVGTYDFSSSILQHHWHFNERTSVKLEGQPRSFADTK